MSKQIVSLALALLIFLPTLAKVWICSAFKINQAYISKTICEQKQNLDNTCQGHCQLNKQLKAAQQDQTNHKQIIEQLLQLIAVAHMYAYKLPARIYIVCMQKSSGHTYNSQMLKDYLPEIFYPPKPISFLF